MWKRREEVGKKVKKLQQTLLGFKLIQQNIFEILSQTVHLLLSTDFFMSCFPLASVFIKI